MLRNIVIPKLISVLIFKLASCVWIEMLCYHKLLKRKERKIYFGGQWCSYLCLCLSAVTLGLENLATFSLAVNSVPYFMGIMHYQLEDAANMLTNYMGVSYILSILVAIVADTWIGRYKSVLFSGFFEFLVRYKNPLSIPL